MPTQVTARVAFACTISILGGLFLPFSAFTSLNRAIALWICICITVGLVLGGMRDQKIRIVAIHSALAALLIPLACIGFYWVRWLATWLKDPENPLVLIPLFSGKYGPTSPFVLIGLSVLAATGFIASIVSIFLAALAATPITEFFRKAFNFGPEGFNRVNSTLIAIIAVVGSILVLFSSIGSA